MKTQSEPLIFISYSSKDDGIANAIVSYLDEKGVKCFIAPRDISAGSDYAATLMKAIESATHVVVVLTDNSNKSDHVRAEIDRAFNLKKPAILFRTEDIPLSKSLEYYLSTYQWLDAYQLKPAVYFEQLYSLLKGLPIPPIPKRVTLPRKIFNNALLVYLLATLTIFFVIGLPILTDYSFFNRKNSRNIRLIDAVRNSGLDDIEPKNVGKSRNIAPPEELYINARSEIFVSGVTLRTTLEEHREIFREAVAKGVKIRLLLLHPQSNDSNVVNMINSRKQSYSTLIQGSLDIIRNDSDLFHNPMVEVRFTDNVPPLVGLLIDGDVSAKDTLYNDKNGLIRVGSYFRSPKHNDWFLQFRKDSTRTTAFEDYAAEYRHYWRQSKSHPEFFR